MSRLEVGVIGGGHVAEAAHLPGYQSNTNTDIVAIAELDNKRRQTISEEYNPASAYETGKDLIEKESLDAVSICTPPSTHAELVIAAAEKGWSVYCEKPLAVNTEDAARMRSATTANDVTAAVGYLFRHYGNYIRVQKMIENDVLRGISDVHTVYRTSLPHSEWFLDPERSGGGVVADLVPHILDFYSEVFGGMPSLVDATLESIRTDQVADSANISLAYPNGVTHKISVGWNHDREFRQETIIGQNGVLKFDNETLTGHVHDEEILFKHGHAPRLQIGPLLQLWGRTPEDWNQRRVDRFVDAVNESRGGITLRDVEIVELIVEIQEVGDGD